MRIEKIYVINLSDKYHRWRKFKLLDKRFRRFSAIDSRTNPFIYKDKNLTFDPVGLAFKLYFSQCPGAIGAYLSHFSIWQDILLNNINCAMILEDDAKFNDVKYFLENEPSFNDSSDFYQLNKRYHANDYWNNFDGLESYVLTKRGAKILVDATHGREHFNGIISFSPNTINISPRLRDAKIFRNEPMQYWDIPNSISCPVDKLVGFCAHPSLPEDKKLRINFIKIIGLFVQQQKSDILKDGIKDWNFCTEKELEEFISSEQYEYWKKQ